MKRTVVKSQSKQACISQTSLELRIEPSDEAIHDVKLNPIKEEENDLETNHKYHCRTCLKSTEGMACIAINQNFFSEKTVKEMIVFLVPEMNSKLRDDEVVCDDCLEVLKSTMLFIEKCVEVEAIFAKKEQNEKETVFLETCKLEIEEPQETVVVEEKHEYWVKDEIGGTESDAKDEIQEDNAQNKDEVLIVIETVPHRYEKDMAKLKLKPDTPPSNTKSIMEPLNTLKKSSFSCLTCLERFPTKEEYEVHLEFHPPHSCDVCGKTFKKRESLRAHKFTHNDPNSFLCEVCGKGFKDWSNLRPHIQGHTSERSYACDKCPKTFKKRRTLDQHVKYIHDKMLEAQCTVCGIMSYNKTSLQTHMKLVHFKEKPFQCNICQRRFGRSDYLHNHKLRHTGESRPRKKPPSGDNKRRWKRQAQYSKQSLEELLPCKFCGEMYKGAVVLKRHLLLHLKRWACQFCPLTFTCNARLQKHEKSHQGGTVNVFRCNVCWMKLETKEELDKHVAIHDKPRHACDLCGGTFNRKFLLNQHKLTEHSDIPDMGQIDTIVHETLVEAGVLST